LRVYIVRHALPDYGEWDGNPETRPADPPLSDDGREMVETLAKWHLETEWIPNFILASPKLRCQETAEILRDTFGLPSVDTKQSMDSNMSIRKMVLKAAQDKSMTRVMMVSHHETIAHGLRVLNLDPNPHLDMFAMAEMRAFRVDRKDGHWKEHMRLPPSDLGLRDYY
jgi:phosphohistidine phosphatase SixA